MKCFIRAKTVHGQIYYYLVRNERIAGKVRQETLAYLGKYQTIGQAREQMPRLLEYLRSEIERLERRSAGHLALVPKDAITGNGGTVPTYIKRGASFRSDPAKFYWHLQTLLKDCRRQVEWLERTLKRLDELTHDGFL